MADKKAEPEYDHVNQPDHYKHFSNGSEVIDITEHLGFNLGNAVKYLARAGKKPGTDATTDMRKALRYIQREISLRQGIEDAPKIADGSMTIRVGWGDER